MLFCLDAISRGFAFSKRCIGSALLGLGLFGVAAIVAEGAAFAQSPPSNAAPRLALLVANANYAGVDPIPRLSNDVAALADELRRSGFDAEVKQNQTRAALQSALDAFKAKIKPGSTVLVYFGGFGIQSAGQNYFIPVGAQIWSEPHVARDGVSIESVLAGLNASGARVKLAILDLSRRNPYERNFRLYSAGLGSVGIPLNTLIISAAGQNQLIRESAAGDTVFMRELLKEMLAPGVTADVVFNKTRLGVSVATNNEEVPWVSSSLTEEFYFRPRAQSDEKREEARREDPKKEEPPKLEPKKDEAKKDETKKEESKPDQAKKEDLKPEQPKPEEPKKDDPRIARVDPGPRGCADQVSVSEARGVVDFDISSPCRGGATLPVTAGKLSLQATLDKNGKARLRIPLFQESTEIAWTGVDGATKTETVRFNGFRDAFRIALVWRQPVDLQLHVVEPGGNVSGETGHVWRKRPNDDLKSGVGSLQVDAEGSPGAERIEVYDVAPARNPRGGLFKVHVDFAARGDIAAPPYCGTSETAAPGFEIWVLRYGRLEPPRRFGFRAEECGSPPRGRRPAYFADVNATP